MWEKNFLFLFQEKHSSHGHMIKLAWVLVWFCLCFAEYTSPSFPFWFNPCTSVWTHVGSACFYLLNAGTKAAQKDRWLKHSLPFFFNFRICWQWLWTALRRRGNAWTLLSWLCTEIGCCRIVTVWFLWMRIVLLLGKPLFNCVSFFLWMHVLWTGLRLLSWWVQKLSGVEHCHPNHSFPFPPLGFDWTVMRSAGTQVMLTEDGLYVFPLFWLCMRSGVSFSLFSHYLLNIALC